MKTISAVTAAVVFAACATAFAQAPAPEPVPAPIPAPNQDMMTAPPTEAAPPNMGEEKKADKPMKGGKGKGKAKGQGRGLDRPHP